MSYKTTAVRIQGRLYYISADQSEDETHLQNIAAALNALIADAVQSAPKLPFSEHLILVGLEQQDKLFHLQEELDSLQKENAALADKLAHYPLGEALGCISDYRETIALLNHRCDALQRENDALQRQLVQNGKQNVEN